MGHIWIAWILWIVLSFLLPKKREYQFFSWHLLWILNLISFDFSFYGIQVNATLFYMILISMIYLASQPIRYTQFFYILFCVIGLTAIQIWLLISPIWIWLIPAFSLSFCYCVFICLIVKSLQERVYLFLFVASISELFFHFILISYQISGKMADTSFLNYVFLTIGYFFILHSWKYISNQISVLTTRLLNT
ncbi:YphA family membrane protein [Saliterribacillus persicus]|uniref:Uncharacterized protein n=1 Tax=Saliterribacillus persicus TaxID=930114 RepID=A0A368XAC2_9BACI|nr:hypothetical protein DFR57_11278 [Saliterribacillus persicus]